MSAGADAKAEAKAAEAEAKAEAKAEEKLKQRLWQEAAEEELLVQRRMQRRAKRLADIRAVEPGRYRPPCRFAGFQLTQQTWQIIGCHLNQYAWQRLPSRSHIAL